MRQKSEGIDKDLRGEEREDRMNKHKHRLKERKEVDEEFRKVMKDTESDSMLYGETARRLGRYRERVIGEEEKKRERERKGEGWREEVKGES